MKTSCLLVALLILLPAGMTAAEKPNIIYILADDLGESRNLAATQPEKLKELRAKYDEMMKTAVPSGAVSGGLKE